MKCAEFEKDSHLLLDGEAVPPEKHLLEKHLTGCRSCAQDFAELRGFKNLLESQPAILPAESFDRRMLQTIENHPAFQQKNRRILFPSFLVFSNPIFTAALFAVGIGFAFLLGRISVSQTSRPILVTQEQPQTELSKNPAVSEPAEKIVTQTKFVTRNVEIPVIKEKIVEKKIYVGSQIHPTLTEAKAAEKAENRVVKTSVVKQSDIAGQFNFRDLQPTATVSYRIIKKGETNE